MDRKAAIGTVDLCVENRLTTVSSGFHVIQVLCGVSRVLENEQVTIGKMSLKVIEDDWIAVTPIIPDKPEKTKIDLFRAAIGHIGTHPAKTARDTFDDPPHTKITRIIKEDNRIRLRQPYIQRAVIRAVNYPFVPTYQFFGATAPFTPGGLDPSLPPEFPVEMDDRQAGFQAEFR